MKTAIFALALAINVPACRPKRSAPPAPALAPLASASEAQTEKRRESLSYFVKSGLFDTIDAREIPTNGRLWSEMKFSDKQRLAESLCAYYYKLDALPSGIKGAEYWLRFKDSRTDKLIGRYAPSDGLKVY